MLDLPSLRGLRPRRYGLQAWSDHVAFGYDLVTALRPGLVVELGTHAGESFFTFCQAAQEQGTGSRCYAVDTWQGDPQAGYYGEEVFAGVEAHRQAERYADFAWLVRKTFDEARGQFSDASIDLLHIDGCHTYEAARHDFENWLPAVKPGGIVLLHDIAARQEDFGVWRLWDEIAGEADGAFAFTHGWGLGVWRKRGGVPPPDGLLTALLGGDQAAAQWLRRYYSHFAAHLRLRHVAEGEARLATESSRLREELALAVPRAAERDKLAADLSAELALSARLREREQEAVQQASSAQARLAASRASVAGVRKALAELRASEAEREQELGDTRSALAVERGRLRAMRAAWSWRVAAPLRSVARSLGFKPSSPPAAAPAAALLAGAIESKIDPKAGAYRCSLDEPHGWRLAPGRTRFLGWCLDGENQPVAEIRIRFGRELQPVRVGLPRHDVVQAFELPFTALACGFEAFLELPPGRYLVQLEARDRGGAWHRLVTSRASVSRKHDENAAANYAAWIRTNAPFGVSECEALTRHVQKLAAPPLISVVMPTFETPLRWLRKAVESVRAQVYPDWELCIADDASSDPALRRMLEDYARTDSRIKLALREARGHVSAATNSALALAQGSWIAFLDHDDELHPSALAYLALEIAAHPSAQVIYTDEDKISERGRRYSPYFKPAWNPDLLTGQNYLCHLTAYRADRVQAVGGLRIGVEGCQDWDLALRATEGLSPEAIRHIPRVLYHWRSIAGSTARAQGEKDYILEAAQRTLRDHVERVGYPVAKIEPVPGGHWHISYPLPEPAPKVTILIPTRNTLSLLRQTVESVLEKTDYPEFEIVIIDNQSDDPATLAWFREITARDARVRIHSYDAPFNYAAMHQDAIAPIRGGLVCLLNNDMEVISGRWLREMAAHALRPGVGAVGAKLYFPDGSIQHAGVVLGVGGVAGHAFKHFPREAHGQRNRLNLTQNYSAVTAACVVFRRELWDETGGMDAERLKIAFNDVDFCLRLQAAGYRNVWTPAAELFHHESASRGFEDSPEKVKRFLGEAAVMQEKWGSLLLADPAYSPNLTLQFENFSVAARSRVPPV